MMDSSGFLPGVWCGAIFGAAVVLLIVSLIFENSLRKENRQLRRVREIWSEEPIAANGWGRRFGQLSEYASTFLVRND